MSEAISWVLELAIKDGQLDAFKALAQEMSDATQADEPGTSHYEWFISEDGKAVHIYERYADSAVLMTHIGNFGEKFAERFLAWAEPTRWLVYGDPSAEVRETLASFGVVHMAQFAGFTR
ncbi:MAG: antibiotic biosynthesis monooxygenase [Kiloniellales bacterium]